MFEPSKKLILLYYKAGYKSDKETRELAKDILNKHKIKITPSMFKQRLKEMIQEEIYSLFIRLSKRQVTELGSNGSFHEEIIPDIIYYLDSDKCNLYLNLLYKELYEYAKTNPEYHWGNLYVRDNKICLNIKQLFLDEIKKNERDIEEIMKNPGKGKKWIIT